MVVVVVVVNLVDREDGGKMGLFDFLGFDPNQQFSNSDPGIYNIPKGMNQQFSNSGYGNFPVQQFQDNSFANMMSQMPQTQNFMELLSQQPRQEDYSPGWGRGILAALAGIAGGLGGNPSAGGDIAGSIAGAPFLNAMSQYQTRLGGARQGAGLENNLMGLSRQFANDQFEKDKFGQQLGFQQDQLAQQGGIANREIDTKNKILENQIAQAGLDRALQEKKISVDQYQAATGRIDANANASQSNAMAEFYTRKHPGGYFGQPNAAMTKEQLKATLFSDPVLRDYVDYEGDIDIEKLRKDPNAAMRLQQLYQQLGLIPRPDIALPQGR